MIRLSERVAKKTGLSIMECESLMAVVAEELIETLRVSPTVLFFKLGVMFRANNVDGRRLVIILDKPVQEKLMKPTGEEKPDEIIFK
jgi:hypothetical protein